MPLYRSKCISTHEIAHLVLDPVSGGESGFPKGVTNSVKNNTIFEFNIDANPINNRVLDIFNYPHYEDIRVVSEMDNE